VIARSEQPVEDLRFQLGANWTAFLASVNWLGGYPVEVAKPKLIVRFYTERGYLLPNLSTTHRLGCNEFVFQKVRSEA